MYPLSSRGGFGVASQDGWVIPPQYKFVYPFYSGYAYAKTQDGNELLIDLAGRRIDLGDLANSRSFEFVPPNSPLGSPGFLVVRSRSEQVVYKIDSELKLSPIEAFCCDYKLSVYHGGGVVFIEVRSKTRSCYVISQPTGVVLTLEGVVYVDPPYSDTDLIAIKHAGSPALTSYYSVKKREIVSERFHYASSFSDGLGLVQKECDSNFEFLDANMQAQRDLEFKWADVFRHGLAAGLKGDKSGYFDVKGNCKFEIDGYLRPFNRLGHAVIEVDDDRRDIVDINGVPKSEFMESCTFFDGDYPYYEVEKDGRDFLLTGSLEPIDAAKFGS